MASSSTSTPRILLYILRRDIRLADNPIFHHASLLSAKVETTQSDRFTTSDDTAPLERKDSPLESEQGRAINATHLLPVYVFPVNQVEVSGFLRASTPDSPYPEARSQVAGVWRTGPHRAKFLAESIWDLKKSLENLQCGSGLVIRVGMIAEVVEHILDWFAGPDEGEKRSHGKKGDVVDIWMTDAEGTEEKRDVRDVKRVAERNGVKFTLWNDEKYFIDDLDQPFQNVSELPDVYTNYRKSVEPLRSRPRKILPPPKQLLPLPPDLPPQKPPFEIPDTLEDLKSSLLTPLLTDPTFGLPNPPIWPPGTESAHPYTGGETTAHSRLTHLITCGAMTNYKTTRNGLLGSDFSTKLSAYLAQGSITARQIHWAMHDFEEGRGEGKNTPGYGRGENEGTAAVRFELLWRDYMRLCSQKFGAKMFRINGIRDRDGASNPKQSKTWSHLTPTTTPPFQRFCTGNTGTSLIDASNRELFLTGYTSNRARQNVASFLSSHLGLDWRLGAEWYECLLIDYDVSNNWGNWQYVAGVGNDPRLGRRFNPVKQMLEYDPRGEYVRAWVGELRGVRLVKDGGHVGERNSEGGDGDTDPERVLGLCQPWMLSEGEKQRLGLRGLDSVERPLVRIDFSVDGSRGGGNGRGRGRGGGRRRGRG